MKTPIQELIENLDTFIGQGMSYSEWKKLTYSGKPSIERYLEKEKEVKKQVTKEVNKHSIFKYSWADWPSDSEDEDY